LTKADIKKAQRALNKKLEEQYSAEEIDTLEWYTDTETADSYTWRFYFPGDGKIRNFIYVKSTQTVVIKRVD
jgi:hypothetical protein